MRPYLIHLVFWVLYLFYKDKKTDYKIKKEASLFIYKYEDAIYFAIICLICLLIFYSYFYFWFGITTIIIS